jgi:hypothetical protein
MKPAGMLMILAIALVGQGCVSRQGPLVLDCVGPAPVQTTVSTSNGKLVVFSAPDVYGHFNDLPYRRFYSDYKLYSEDGKLLQTVHNQSEGPIGGPKEVELPAGEYRIVARANGYGTVAVPVRIVAHRFTDVHLEGGTTSIGETAPSRSNVVRLPDGQVAGWQTDSERSTKH